MKKIYTFKIFCHPNKKYYRSFKSVWFILEYLGKEYAKRSNKTKYDTYQMEMGKHYIDAREEGSLARFINHHDPANAKFEKKIVGGSQRCGVFATNNISKDDEITCSYLTEDNFKSTIYKID